MQIFHHFPRRFLSPQYPSMDNLCRSIASFILLTLLATLCINCIFQSQCPPTANFIGTRSELFWDPIKVQDITWNFEKFLIDPHGHPLRRYHPSVDPSAIASDIELLLPSTTRSISRSWMKLFRKK